MPNDQAYVIEVEGRPAGVVVAHPRRGFQFFATVQPFLALDGRFFSRVDQAVQAARSLGRGRVSLPAHTRNAPAQRTGRSTAETGAGIARRRRRIARHGARLAG